MVHAGLPDCQNLTGVFNQNIFYMSWYYWVAVVSAAICTSVCLYCVAYLVKRGRPVDYSKKSGNTSSAILYSYTGAMNPAFKESAYLNLPYYIAGVVYHLGTFLGLLLFILFLAQININEGVKPVSAVLLFTGAACGVAILLKRISDKKVRLLSTFDDYLSNILVTTFQVTAGLALLFPHSEPFYFLTASLMLIWLPFGKLKHVIYFFAARFHLGYFYGWRNVWPVKTREGK